MEQTIEIPADVKTVTLELGKRCGFTLRQLLPQVEGEVELAVVDEFVSGPDVDRDVYRLRANNGRSLLRKLMRSRIVEGEHLLGLTPSLKVAGPVPQLVNGSLVQASGTGGLQLFVRPPRPDEGEEG